jgi:hypothetical protein
MTRQRDFKRMLAYSSVEHMGILVLGIGLGGGATFGALLHLSHELGDQGRVVPVRRATSTASFGEQAHRRGARRAPLRPRVGGAVPRGLPRDHRLAALRRVPQRADDPARVRSPTVGSWSPGSSACS